MKAAAQEAIDHLVAGEYEACVSLMDEEMQAAISAEVLAANMEAMNELFTASHCPEPLV